jgi:DNA-binding LytR/AlgR family response regulator
MVLNCIIVDDDEMAGRLIKECVDQTDFLNLIAVLTSANAALKILKEQKIDLVFLDIEMPEINGIDFIKNLDPMPQVIMITSSSKYALEAFDNNVTGYLMKPISYSKFLKASCRARDIHGLSKVSEDNEALFVKEDSRLVKVQTKDILYIEAMADYILIYTHNKRYTIHSTMKAIEIKLNSKEFVRVHRSFIVRLDQITSIEHQHLLIGDKSLPIGLSHKESLFSKLKLL